MLGVLVAERDRPDLCALVGALSRLDVEFFGAVFPGLIHGGKHVERGTLLLDLPADRPPLLVTGLDRPRWSPPARSEAADAVLDPPGAHTAVVLVDGLTANVSRLLAWLHGRLGDSVHYVGGGAGSITLQQRPCVFTREGVHQDAAVIALTSRRSRLGVRHGWERIDGPVVATRTSGNVIHELNWQAAFDVYRTILQPWCEEELTAENVFRASNAFPFGITKEGQEDVVRDPVSAGEEGSLVCVGEVPENAVLNVLRGDRTSLVEAAGQAADDCCAGGRVRATGALLVDCVSRTIFLGEEFESELQAVSRRLRSVDPALEVEGILTLGEISSHGEGFVEFLNKTIVAALLHE